MITTAARNGEAAETSLVDVLVIKLSGRDVRGQPWARMYGNIELTVKDGSCLRHAREGGFRVHAWLETAWW